MNRRALLMAALALPAAATEPEAAEYRLMVEDINALLAKSTPMVQWAAVMIVQAPWKPYELVSTANGTVMAPTMETRRLHAFLQAASGLCSASKGALWT